MADDDMVPLSAAIDIGAVGFELPQVRGWRRAQDLIHEETGGTLAIYELIQNAGRAFAEAFRLKGVEWEDMRRDWDEYIIEYVKKIVKRINDEDQGIDSSYVLLPDELLKLAKEVLMGRKHWEP